MRWFSCRILKNVTKELFHCHHYKYISSSCPLNQSYDTKTKNISAPTVAISPSWRENEEIDLRNRVLDGMVVINDFVNQEEENDIMAEVEPYLKKMRYEYDHWDNAIHGFRETERKQWNDKNTSILNRVRLTAFKTVSTTLEHVHVLDLAPNGHIKPHVDSVRFCGSVIAGICLLSDAVMRLVHTKNTELAVDVLLKRRCLYMIRDVARYDFTHEILPQETSIFAGERIPRGRRISIICRSIPDPQ